MPGGFFRTETNHTECEAVSVRFLIPDVSKDRNAFSYEDWWTLEGRRLKEYRTSKHWEPQTHQKRITSHKIQLLCTTSVTTQNLATRQTVLYVRQKVKFYVCA